MGDHSWSMAGLLVALATLLTAWGSIFFSRTFKVQKDHERSVVASMDGDMSIHTTLTKAIGDAQIESGKEFRQIRNDISGVHHKVDKVIHSMTELAVLAARTDESFVSHTLEDDIRFQAQGEKIEEIPSKVEGIIAAMIGGVKSEAAAAKEECIAIRRELGELHKSMIAN